jgi:hypothetical protein
MGKTPKDSDPLGYKDFAKRIDGMSCEGAPKPEPSAKNRQKRHPTKNKVLVTNDLARHLGREQRPLR